MAETNAEFVKEWRYKAGNLSVLAHVKEGSSTPADKDVGKSWRLLAKAILDACGRIEEADKKIKDWGKDQIFHYCEKGRIKPYSTALCSSCNPRAENREQRNFNAFEKIEQQQEAIKAIRQDSDELDAKIKDGKHDDAWPDQTKYIKDDAWAEMRGEQLAYHRVLRLLANSPIKVKE